MRNVMKNKKLEKLIIAITTVFVILSLWFMFGKDLFVAKSDAIRGDSTQMMEATNATSEIKDGAVIEQRFICSSSTISQVGIVFARDYTISGVRLTIELLQKNKTVAINSYDVSEIADQHRTFVIPPETLADTKNKEFTIRIYTVSDEETGLKLLYNAQSGSDFLFGGKKVTGTLCFSVTE